MTSNTSSELLCPDWVFANGSNVHACKNRDWFTDYTPFESTISPLIGGGEIRVHGIGTVVLPTQKTPHGSGPDNHGQWTLHEVLHVPSSLCNIIGVTDEDFRNKDKKLTTQFGSSDGSSMGTMYENGQPIAYFQPNRPLFVVKLSEPPIGPVVGPNVLRPDGMYALSVTWPQSERERWEAHKEGRVIPPGYTNEEKAWIKKHYTGEWKFLRQHGLSIHKEEQREEGRLIVRGLMEAERKASDVGAESEKSGV